LRQHPEVKEAVILAREDDTGNNRLITYFVPRLDGKADIDVTDLRDYLKDKLPEYMVPSAFVKLDALPLTPSGKVDRKALPAAEGKRLDTREFIAPRDTLELQLTQIWEEVLNVRPIGVLDNFFDLGGHSLLAIHLLGKIQKEFGREIPLVSLFQEPTIEQLASILRQNVPETLSVDAEEDDQKKAVASSLVIFQDNNANIPLFFVHPSGGSVHWYADLARQMGPDQPFYGLQAQGVNGAVTPHESIVEMARHYVAALQTRQPRGPYLLGSWSMGIVIVYEMAQQLYAQGKDVPLLAILDQGPFMPNEPSTDNAEFLQGMFNGRITFPLDELRKLEEEEQFKYVLKAIKKAKMISKFVRVNQFRDYVTMLKTQMNAWNDYEMKQYPGKVTLFRSSERHDDDVPEWDLGWNKVALGGVEVFEVPGNHNTMLHDPHVPVLAGILKDCISQVVTEVQETK